MISVTNFTKNNSPIKELFFAKIASEILPADYELSLVFVGDKKAQTLNKKYRNKDYIPNVLSFPIDKKSGEIFINLKQLEKETVKFQMDFPTIIIYMFIHGCLHLKGLDHGAKMDSLEKKYLKMFA